MKKEGKSNRAVLITRSKIFRTALAFLLCLTLFTAIICGYGAATLLNSNFIKEAFIDNDYTAKAVDNLVSRMKEYSSIVHIDERIIDECFDKTIAVRDCETEYSTLFAKPESEFSSASFKADFEPKARDFCTRLGLNQNEDFEEGFSDYINKITSFYTSELRLSVGVYYRDTRAMMMPVLLGISAGALICAGIIILVFRRITTRPYMSLFYIICAFGGVLVMLFVPLIILAVTNIWSRFGIQPDYLYSLIKLIMDRTVTVGFYITGFVAVIYTVLMYYYLRMLNKEKRFQLRESRQPAE